MENKNMEKFDLFFNEPYYRYFKSNHHIVDDVSKRIYLVSNPFRKWYKKTFQYITLGLYKAPWEYTVKLVDPSDVVDGFNEEINKDKINEDGRKQ